LFIEACSPDEGYLCLGVAWPLYFDAYSRLLIAVFDFHFGGIGNSSQ